MRKSVFIVAVLGLVLYPLGYGMARWRKCIVMQEYVLKEQGLLIRRTGPGRDVRDTWQGRVKNRLNPAVYFAFFPLCRVEDRVRGFSMTLRSEPEP